MRKLSEEEALNLIRCTGKDGKQHYMLPWEEKTLCEMTVKHGGWVPDDYMCYECDCIEFGKYWPNDKRNLQNNS